MSIRIRINGVNLSNLKKNAAENSNGPLRRKFLQETDLLKKVSIRTEAMFSILGNKK